LDVPGYESGNEIFHTLDQVKNLFRRVMRFWRWGSFVDMQSERRDGMPVAFPALPALDANESAKPVQGSIPATSV
jgi:hypothetical protein